MIEQLAPKTLATRLASTAPPRVLDVREPWEWEIGHIAGSLLVPLQTLPAAIEALDRGADYVLVCHHGVRSQHAAQFMAQAGFVSLANLAGGIDAWSHDVDAGVARY